MEENQDKKDFRNKKIDLMMERMKEAYDYSPSGSFWKRFIPGVCKHLSVRCSHGDEIIHRRFRRRICMVCGRSLKGPLPEVCFFTGEPHGNVSRRMESD